MLTKTYFKMNQLSNFLNSVLNMNILLLWTLLILTKIFMLTSHKCANMTLKPASNFSTSVKEQIPTLKQY